MLNSASNADAVSFALSLILIFFDQVESEKSFISMKVLNNDTSGNNTLNSRQIRSKQTVTPKNGISVDLSLQSRSITMSPIEKHQDNTEDHVSIRASKPVSRKVICYYNSEANSRKGKGKFLPEDIDPELCTHINYCFAVLNENSHLMVPKNPEIDIKMNFYSRVVALKKKNPKLKVMLTLDGIDDSEKNAKYSNLVASATLRKLFVQETVVLLQEYSFDGLDIDWEYLGYCRYCGFNDKRNFVLLVKELREAFDKAEPPLLLTSLIARVEDIVLHSYNISDLEKYLDFFNVIAYHFHGPGLGTTGHHSSIHTESLPGGNNIDYYMNYLVEKGVSKQKLMLGISFWGVSFTLQDPKMNGLSAPAQEYGRPGPYTEEIGILSYFEMCDFIKSENWIVVRDSGACPYAYKGDQWVSFDDPECVREKSHYAMTHGYGGVMVFDITMDDFKGSCSKETYPLLRAVNYQLGFKEGKAYTMRTFTNGNDERLGASVAETISKKTNIYFVTVLCFLLRLF